MQRGPRFVPMPLACTSSVVACNANVTGTLGVGDCTTSNGAYFDVYSVLERVGDIVDVTLWPTTTTLTNPLLTVVPPPADASKTPLTFGGAAAEVAYVISSSGTWGIGAGTHDLFGSGSYIVSVQCSPDDAPQEPQNCVYQNLLCGQTGEWYLTNQSCRFSSDPTRVFADYSFYGVAGDFVQFSVLSSDFTPLFGVYDPATGKQVVTESLPSPTNAIGSFVVPKNGFYDIVVTSNESYAVGFFAVTMQCVASGCIPPLIQNQPQNVSVAYGTRAKLLAGALAVGTVSYEWHDVSGLPSAVGSGTSFLTPPVTATQTYNFTATTRCGTATSRTIVVTAQAPPHHRAARH